MLKHIWMVRRLCGLFAVALMAGLLNSCGSGAVSSPPASEGTLLVLPASVTMFPNTPVTFTISGGTGAYSVFTSNAAVLPITSQAVSGNQFTVTPGDLIADTPVTLTVRDSVGGTATVTAQVRVAVLENAVTFTPIDPSPGVDCGGAVCGGGEANLIIRAVQNGVALVNRQIQFDVVTGQFGFVQAGSTLTTSVITANTDATGRAAITIRANAAAPTQGATLRITDLTTGLTRFFAFTISQYTDGAATLTVLPSTFTWTGQDNTRCFVNGTTTHRIFGGSPPYLITQTVPQFSSIDPELVTESGGGVNVTVTGTICSATGGGNIFTVTDFAGRTTTFSVGNQLGTTAPAPEPPSLSPSAVTLNCGQTASIIINGGGPFGYASERPQQVDGTTLTGNVLTIERFDPYDVPASVETDTTTVIRVTDGTTIRLLTVTLTLNGLGTTDCP